MRIDVLTLFPGMFHGPLTESILRRAQDEGLLDFHFHDLKEFGLGNYHQVDDSPYGGGAGMVMRADVVVPAIEAITFSSSDSAVFFERAMPQHRESRSGASSMLLDSSSAAADSSLEENVDCAAADSSLPPSLLLRREGEENTPHRIYLSPRGKRLTQERIEELAKLPHLLLLCGRYEGIDQRIIDGGYIDEELSIGEYVLTGGELPAMVLIDAVARQIPGVLGKDESSMEESFSPALDRKREYPHYTRPEEFRGRTVPEVLLSGNHAAIEQWRKDHLS